MPGKWGLQRGRPLNRWTISIFDKNSKFIFCQSLICAHTNLPDRHVSSSVNLDIYHATWEFPCSWVFQCFFTGIPMVGLTYVHFFHCGWVFTVDHRYRIWVRPASGCQFFNHSSAWRGREPHLFCFIKTVMFSEAGRYVVTSNRLFSQLLSFASSKMQLEVGSKPQSQVFIKSWS